MKLIQQLTPIIGIVFFAFFSNKLYAATLYRHLPFSVTINANDTLVVDYDDTFQQGIVCQSSKALVQAAFSYKGHDKSAKLPLILENTHVPNKEQEELADSTGLFTLSMNNSHHTKNTVIQCDYASPKKIGSSDNEP